MLHVTSEIKKLKEVLLHRPGRELLNLTPDTLGKLLFDDIPYLKDAIKEHDEFAQVLKDNEIKVVYLEDLMTETLDSNPELRKVFIEQFIKEAKVKTEINKDLLFHYLDNIKDNKELVLKTMEGIRVSDIHINYGNKESSLVELTSDESNFLAEPMPNLYFTRDPFASVGNGIVLNKMYSETRSRETIYAEYIFKYHPKYIDKVEKFYDRNNLFSIEGGDILNLNEHTLAIGISERTSPEGIELLSKNLFNNNDSLIDTVLAFKIPNCRAFMHLDTVFTQVDYDKFVYHPGIMDTLVVYEITMDNNKLKVKQKEGNLDKILEEYLHKDITLIPCAGGDAIASEREQWNYGTNTLCIKPGVVVVYNRNDVTNELLRSYGIKVLEINGAELARGRGGPRCMSMPLNRED